MEEPKIPNWCNNDFKVSGEKEQIDAFEKFLDDNNGKDWFDFFHPCPAELKDGGPVSFHDKPNEALIEKYGYSDWYSWSVNNWGCKWNCDAQDWTRDDDNTIVFWFDSPWSPPITLYDKITEDGFAVEAQYHEEGMCLVGEYIDGFDNDYTYDDLESLDDIPERIVENWNLRQMLEDQAEWEDEEELIEEDDEETENGKSN